MPIDDSEFTEIATNLTITDIPNIRIIIKYFCKLRSIKFNEYIFQKNLPKIKFNKSDSRAYKLEELVKLVPISLFMITAYDSTKDYGAYQKTFMKEYENYIRGKPCNMDILYNEYINGIIDYLYILYPNCKSFDFILLSIYGCDNLNTLFTILEKFTIIITGDQYNYFVDRASVTRREVINSAKYYFDQCEDFENIQMILTIMCYYFIYASHDSGHIDYTNVVEIEELHDFCKLLELTSINCDHKTTILNLYKYHLMCEHILDSMKITKYFWMFMCKYITKVTQIYEVRKFYIDCVSAIDKKYRTQMKKDMETHIKLFLRYSKIDETKLDIYKDTIISIVSNMQ
jgi:hypothetical protein